MSDTARVLDDAIELALRVSTTIDAGLLADIRRQRRRRSTPFDEEDQASKDLRAIGRLVRDLHVAATGLVAIAERYDNQQARRVDDEAS